MHGELAGTGLERWYAARGWPTEAAAAGAPEAAGAGSAAGPRLWLRTGGGFDVVEVPGRAGREAVRRLLDHGQAALRPGPVGMTGPDRCGFLVAPGAAEDLPELLEWLDWGGIELGIEAHGRGGRVPAPGPADWLHDPSAPAPEVIALLATIAQACWLDRLGRSVPPVVPAVRLGPPRGEVGAGTAGGSAVTDCTAADGTARAGTMTDGTLTGESAAGETVAPLSAG